MSAANHDFFNVEPQDKTARYLILTLLATIVLCWGLMIWATVQTYHLSAPIPKQFINSDNQVLMTQESIVAGKGGFQKADLMDYGSLYGMGSYYGEDFTAQYLMDLFQLTREKWALMTYKKTFTQLTSEQKFTANERTKALLRGLDLTQEKVTIPTVLSEAINYKIALPTIYNKTILSVVIPKLIV